MVKREKDGWNRLAPPGSLSPWASSGVHFRVVWSDVVIGFLGWASP